LKAKKQFRYVRGLKFQIWNGDEVEFRVATNRGFLIGRAI
jgi:hypothetical protein